MRIIPGITARDLPVPPTIDQVVQEFGAPVFTLVSQPHLVEASAGAFSMGGVPVEVSLNYCVYRHPDAPEDPSNFADDIKATRSAIDTATAAGQPAWFVDTLQRMMYPMLWEAVRTVKLGFDPDRPLAERLAEHVNHVVINTVESRRQSSPDALPRLDHEIMARHAQPGSTLNIDGTDVDALTIDTDPNVIGWAADVDDCAVLVAVSRDFADMIDITLHRRRAPPPAAFIPPAR